MADMEFGGDLFTLLDEEGKEQTFELLDSYEENGKLYYALVPYYENPEDMADADDELIVLLSEEDENGEEELVTIEDDEEYNRIGEIFLNRLNEFYDSEE